MATGSFALIAKLFEIQLERKIVVNIAKKTMFSFFMFTPIKNQDLNFSLNKKFV